jgi:hypothetical protein
MKINNIAKVLISSIIIGVIIASLFTEPETRQFQANGQIITYQEKPILRNILVGAAAGGIISVLIYLFNSKGWTLEIGFQEGLIQTKEGVMQDVRGFTMLIVNFDITGKTSPKFYGIALMQEGLGIYFGNKKTIHKWRPLPSHIKDMEGKFGRYWYGLDYNENKKI